MNSGIGLARCRRGEFRGNGASARECLPRDPAGRDADLDHIEPVIEVVAERAGSDLFLQIPVGGGDQTDIDASNRARRRPLAGSRLSR